MSHQAYLTCLTWLWAPSLRKAPGLTGDHVWRGYSMRILDIPRTVRLPWIFPGAPLTFNEAPGIIVRRAGLLWSQQDFEWRWSVPLFKCLTVLEFSFILFDLCLLITFFNFIMNYVPIVTFWIFNYHKIWILSIMFCSIWSYWIIYFLSMFGSVLESCELTGVCLLLPWLIKWK